MSIAFEARDKGSIVASVPIPKLASICDTL